MFKFSGFSTKANSAINSAMNEASLLGHSFIGTEHLLWGILKDGDCQNFESIEEWILKISTPAAAVAVGSGVFMKKFSFGDEEKIRTGKKIIKGSLFSYGFILAIDLILSAIKSILCAPLRIS